MKFFLFVLSARLFIILCLFLNKCLRRKSLLYRRHLFFQRMNTHFFIFICTVLSGFLCLHRMIRCRCIMYIIVRYFRNIQFIHEYAFIQLFFNKFIFHKLILYTLTLIIKVIILDNFFRRTWHFLNFILLFLYFKFFMKVMYCFYRRNILFFFFNICFAAFFMRLCCFPCQSESFCFFLAFFVSSYFFEIIKPFLLFSFQLGVAVVLFSVFCFCFRFS